MADPTAVFASGKTGSLSGKRASGVTDTAVGPSAPSKKNETVIGNDSAISDNEEGASGPMVVKYTSGHSVVDLDVEVFKALDYNRQPPTSVPDYALNLNHNRHLDTLPDPNTRVPLERLGLDKASDYINANFVRGFDGTPAKYICAMGPLETSLSNFWRAIWSTECNQIIMVTKLIEKEQEKCAEYWPQAAGQKKMWAYYDRVCRN